MGARPLAAELRTLARVFLGLGLTAFGGPAAHVALMQRELVRRRAWLEQAEFLDLLSLSQLVPGPSSTELALHLGQRRAGWRGMLVAGVGFILPGSLMVTGLAWAYQRHGSSPAALGIQRGILPVVLALILAATWDLGRSSLRRASALALAAVVLGLRLAGWGELGLLFGSGLLALAARRLRREGGLAGLAAGAGPWHQAWQEGLGSAVEKGFRVPAAGWRSACSLAAGGAAVAAVGLHQLFWVCFKIGALLFGSGYLLLPLMHQELVAGRAWLTERQLLDAIAAGQLTPGPLFSSATFVGYLLAGAAGAMVATVGIFLPGFGYVALSRRLLQRHGAAPALRVFLDGVNAASVALIGATAWELGRSAWQGLGEVLLTLLCLLCLRWGRPQTAWLILGGALTGLLAWGR